MGIKNIFNRKGMTPRVPDQNIPWEYKRYICELDITRNKTIDILNIYKRLLSLSGLKPHFREKDLDFGDYGDSYRGVKFASTVLNVVEFVLQNYIQEEQRLRKEFVNVQIEYVELTSENPTEDQQVFLDELEQINKDSILAKAKTNAEKVITSGHNSELTILESEKNIHELRVKTHKDKKTIAELKNSDNKLFGEEIVKNSSHRALIKNPELAPLIAKRLKRNVSRINPLPLVKKSNVAKKSPLNGKPKKRESYPLTQNPLDKLE